MNVAAKLLGVSRELEERHSERFGAIPQRWRCRSLHT